MIGTPEQDAFLSSHKWAAITTLRRDGSPTSSVVFYGREGDTLFFSTMAYRLKARTLRNDPRIVLTALEEGSPYAFVSVEGTASVLSLEQGDDILPYHVTLYRIWRGADYVFPPNFEEELRQERKVLVKITPTRVSGNPTRGR